MEEQPCAANSCPSQFLAMPVALHFTHVSWSIGHSVGQSFDTIGVASRLASLLRNKRAVGF